MTEPSIPAWILASGSGLSAAVVYLFQQIMNLTKKQAAQGEIIGELRGRSEGVIAFGDRVLSTVRDAASMTPEELREKLKSTEG